MCFNRAPLHKETLLFSSILKAEVQYILLLLLFHLSLPVTKTIITASIAH